jgi:hypothetical protein
MEKKGKNTDLNTLLYPPMMYLVTQFVFWVVSYFKFCKKNVLMEKLENCIYYGIKSAKIHHLPYCPYVWCSAIFLWNFLLNYWIFIFFPERNLDNKCVVFFFKV